MTQITTPAQLKAAYPYQFAKPMDRWAFALPRGWLPIIATACEQIDALVRADKYRHRFHWVQIKEKFGTLRMYWEARGMRGIRVDLISAGDVLSMVPQPKGKGRDRLVATQIAAIVRATEALSSYSCIVCGSAGKLRPHGWTLTLCDEHARQSEQGKRLEISFRSEVYGFDWDSAAVPTVPLRTRHRAVSRFRRDREWWAWYLANLEELPVSFPQAQTLFAGAPIEALDGAVRDQVLQIVSGTREVERLAKSIDEFDMAAADRVLRQSGCALAEEASLRLFGALTDARDFDNVLERALVAFSSIVLGELVAPEHALRGGLLVAQLALLSEGADPLVPMVVNTSGAQLAQAIALARKNGDATQLMRLLATWHPERT